MTLASTNYVDQLVLWRCKVIQVPRGSLIRPDLNRTYFYKPGVLFSYGVGNKFPICVQILNSLENKAF